MLQICENIRLAREAADKTQQQMADLLGVKRTTYANWEGETEPSITKIKEIAEILRVSFYDLIGVDNPSNEIKEAEAVDKKRIDTLELDVLLLKQTIKTLIDDPPNTNNLKKEA